MTKGANYQLTQWSSWMDTSLWPLFGYEIVCNVFTAANVKSQLPLSGPRKQAAESPNAECTTVDILSG